MDHHHHHHHHHHHGSHVFPKLKSSSSLENEKSGMKTTTRTWMELNHHKHGIQIGEDADYKTASIANNDDNKLPTHMIATELDAASFMVRIGPDYETTKEKAPSKEALYDLVGTDFVQTASKVEHITRFLEGHEDCTMLGEEAAGVPRLFVLSVLIPSMCGEKGEHHGFLSAHYFRMKDSTWELLKAYEKDNNHVILPNSVKLLREFVTKAPLGHEINLRPKLIMGIVNTSSCELPYSVNLALFGYNFKPFLTRPQHKIFRGPGYIELVQDVFEFNYLSQWVLSSMIAGWENGEDHVRKIVGNCALVLEGIEDSELPEQILGCFQFQRVRLNSAPLWKPPM